MLAKIAELEAANAKLKAARFGKLLIKVSPKGAMQFNGFGKWPITLYREQWERLYAGREQIAAFIEANVDVLSVKHPE